MSCELVPFVDVNDTSTPSAQPHHSTNLKAAVEDLHVVSIEKCKRGKRLEPLRRRIKIRRVKRTTPRNTGKGKAVVGAMDDDVRPFDLLGLRSAERIDTWKRFWVEADLIGRNHDMRHYLPPKKGPKCVTKMNPNSEFVKHLLEKIKEPSVLHLRGCDQLFSPYASPFSFDKFKTLICLEIYSVSNLTTFPENTISEMTQLQFLLLSHLPIPQLPTDFFSNLVHLRSLTLKDCPNIHSLPEFPKMTALEYLELSHLLIETLPYGCFSCLKELEKLILRGCSKLSSLPSFDPLRKLRDLDLSHCTALQEIELKYLSRNVKKLDLSYTALHNWCVTSSPTSMAIAFTHLFLRDAKVINFKEFPNCRLFHLKVLDVSGARYVKHLDLLKESEALEALDLSRTRIELESIDFISFMEKLRYLILRDCTWLQKLPAMEKLTHLEVLDISGCENLGDLPEDFSSLKKLKELNLSGCSGLKESSPALFDKMTFLENFPNLTNLQTLNISETLGNGKVDTLDLAAAPESRIENLHSRLSKPNEFYIVSTFFIDSGFDRFKLHFDLIVDLISRFHENFEPVSSLEAMPIHTEDNRWDEDIDSIDKRTKTDAESCPISGQTVKMQCRRMVADLEYIRDNIGLLESCPSCTSAEKLLDELTDARSQFQPSLFQLVDDISRFYFQLNSTNFYEVLRRVAKLKLLVPPKQVDALEEQKNKEKETFKRRLGDEQWDLKDIDVNAPEMQNLSSSYDSLTKIQKKCLLHLTGFRGLIKERMIIQLWYGVGLIDPQHEDNGGLSNANSTTNRLPTPNQNLNLGLTASSDPNQEIKTSTTNDATRVPLQVFPTPTIEEIGRKILMALKEKYFIITRYDSNIRKASQIWELPADVHAFVSTRAIEEGFFNVDRETRMLTPHLSIGSQRACLLISQNNLPSSCKLWADYTNSSEKIKCFKTIHTLLNVNARIVDIRAEWFSKMTNLLVFHLGRSQKHEHEHESIEVIDLKFLEEFKNMKQLRLLNLEGFSTMKKLPDSICKATNLKILNLRECSYLEELPAGIGSLNNLTHLDLTDCSMLCMLPKGIRLLSKLEVLKGFVIYYQIGGRQHQNACTLRDLLKFEKLRTLKLAVHTEKFPASSDLHVFNRMKNLCNLRITWQKNYNDSNQQSEDIVGHKAASRWHQLKCWEQRTSQNETEELLLRSNIKKLELRCFPFETAPNWLQPSGLQNLERLYVRGGNLKTLARNTNQDTWGVKILSLRYLRKMDMDGKEFRCNFPHMTYFHAYLCDLLLFIRVELEREFEGIEIDC